jgi:hypothetical protein
MPGLGLIGQLQELMARRQAHERARAARVKLAEQLQERLTPYLEAEATARAEAEAVESGLREAATEEFRATGLVNLAPGLNMRKSTEPKYEPAAALAWATAHGLCLALDTKAFGDLCKKDTTRPEFVTEIVSYKPTIATDLAGIAGELEAAAAAEAAQAAQAEELGGLDPFAEPGGVDPFADQ